MTGFATVGFGRNQVYPRIGEGWRDWVLGGGSNVEAEREGEAHRVYLGTWSRYKGVTGALQAVTCPSQ